MSDTQTRALPPARYVPCQGPQAGPFEAQLRRVAGSAATVLLAGESGSGKSRAAYELHRASERAAGPFVEVDVSALSPTLVEAELFGHEEGAFTGAHRARRGRFQRASGGTLVLDSIENLAPEQQVKLLRVLQERVVEPLGGVAEEVDVRLVATTTLDLRTQVERGAFREDLYYRVAVVTLDVPPLRARLADLPVLVEVLGEHVAARARVTWRPFSDGALARLAEHGWPGNLRELENAIERALVLGAGESGPVQATELDFLAVEIAGEGQRLARLALAHGFTVDELGLAMIVEAVEEQRGNLSAAARQVGLTRRALDYRLRQASAAEADAAPAEATDDREGA